MPPYKQNAADCPSPFLSRSGSLLRWLKSGKLCWQNWLFIGGVLLCCISLFCIGYTCSRWLAALAGIAESQKKIEVKPEASVLVSIILQIGYIIVIYSYDERSDPQLRRLWLGWRKFRQKLVPASSHGWRMWTSILQSTPYRCPRSQTFSTRAKNFRVGSDRCWPLVVHRFCHQEKSDPCHFGAGYEWERSQEICRKN